MTRTDIHRPSTIVPENYDFVCCLYPATDIGDASFLLDQRIALKAHMDRTGGKFSSHEHGGNCHVCGAHCSYEAVYHHAPTNVYIRTGMDCAEKMDIAHPGIFRAFRKNVKDARERKAGMAKAQVVLADAGLSRCWDVFQSAADGWEENTIRDIVGKLVKYGSVSEKQTAFLGTLLEKIERRAEVEAQREAERAAAADIPTGLDGKRAEITGTVLSTKWQDSQFGGALKMLVQHRDGWKVWGTVPSAIDPEKGDTVTFKAKVKVSDRDSKFGFFSRPTAPEVVQRAE